MSKYCPVCGHLLDNSEGCNDECNNCKASWILDSDDSKTDRMWGEIQKSWDFIKDPSDRLEILSKLMDTMEELRRPFWEKQFYGPEGKPDDV